MINAIKLQDNLIADPDKILEVLSSLGHENIKDRGKYIQCSNLDGDNPSAISILKSTLHYSNYSRGREGNLFTLVADEKKCNFPSALEYICDIIGENKSNFNQTIILPFGGFFKEIINNYNEPENSLEIYSEDILPSKDCYSKKFCDDGISIETQKKFGVRYDFDSDSILIPVYNIGHELVGVKSRNNCDNDYSNRWFAWKGYSKTHVVYGLDINYKDIISQDTLIIFESEKGVMQADSMGINCTCAIAGHNISDTQVKIIKSMMVKNIYIAFDEGICEEEIKYEAKKLIVDNTVYKNNVYYLYDSEHKYLGQGSKDSPSDNGKDILKAIMKNCRRKVEDEKNI